MQLCEEKLVFVEERKRWVTYFSLAREEEEEEVRHTRRYYEIDGGYGRVSEVGAMTSCSQVRYYTPEDWGRDKVEPLGKHVIVRWGQEFFFPKIIF